MRAAAPTDLSDDLPNHPRQGPKPYQQRFFSSMKLLIGWVSRHHDRHFGKRQSDRLVVCV